MTFYVQYWYIEHKLLHKTFLSLFTINNHQEPNSKLDKVNEMKKEIKKVKRLDKQLKVDACYITFP